MRWSGDSSPIIPPRGNVPEDQPIPRLLEIPSPLRRLSARDSVCAPQDDDYFFFIFFLCFHSWKTDMPGRESESSLRWGISWDRERAVKMLAGVVILSGRLIATRLVFTQTILVVTLLRATDGVSSKEGIGNIEGGWITSPTPGTRLNSAIRS